jgi:SAM-dependent methyltransferase
MQYAFGDSDLAAERLRLLSEVFSASTRAFVQTSVPDPVPLLVDLGCGPGYCTHFLASLLSSKVAVGLDNSEHFIALAQKTATAGVAFCRHDFTVAPFPVGRADVMYARYGLCHVKDPLTVLETWATQVRPSGLLLLEETEWIRTNCRQFATYLATVEAMLRHQGNELYIGSYLDGIGDSSTLWKQHSRVRRFPVPVMEAARMFHLNIQTWRSNPVIRASYPSAEVEQLERDLEGLTGSPDGGLEIEWGLRQMVFKGR